MRAAVVHEGAYGAEQVARAVAAGLARHLEVAVLEVDPGRPRPPVDLLLVGGPSPGLGLSPAVRGADVRTGVLRVWLSHVDLEGVRAAAFDIKPEDRRWLPGAARGTARLLARRGAVLVAGPQSYLRAPDRPVLLPGELGRAEVWGHRLGALAVARAALGIA